MNGGGVVVVVYNGKDGKTLQYLVGKI